jgi:pentatricopeptide repeat protein
MQFYPPYFERIGISPLLFYNSLNFAPPSKVIISWATLMSCYSKNKRYDEVVKVFDEMVNEGVVVPESDEVTITTVISACAHLGALGLGKEVHFYLMMNGFGIDVYIGSTLIDMYAKCGSLERLLLVFFGVL